MKNDILSLNEANITTRKATYELKNKHYEKAHFENNNEINFTEEKS